MGKGAALRSFFRRAVEMDPSVVVTLDADGQHDPDEIPKLIGPILQGACDVVVGSRFMEGVKGDMPFYRRVGLRVINYLAGTISEDSLCFLVL